MKSMTSWVATLAAIVTLGMVGQAQAQTSTRVAVVNIGTVFTKYEKAKAFKVEMEATLKPYKEQAEKIRHAEAFEICEYGRRPNKAEMAKLFPFFE